MTTTQPIARDAFLAQIETTSAQSASAELAAMRRAAAERFTDAWPTRRDEVWRHTSLDAMGEIAFASAPMAPKAQALALQAHASFAEAAAELVFINGRLAPERSRLDAVPGLTVGGLFSEASSDDALHAHFAQYAIQMPRVFVDLNTALFQDGAWILIARGVEIERPIHCLFLTTPDAAPLAVHPRLLVVAGSGARAHILETHVATEDRTYLTNVVSEIVVGADASLTHTKIQRDGASAFHLATLAAHVAEGACFTSCALSLGAALARNDIQVVLDGERAECAVNGLYLPVGRQCHDTHTRIEHAQPNGRSRQMYKGIVDDEARGVFCGRIVVQPHAQQTDAVQSSRALLLSQSAAVHAQPQLEIFADDVQCSHGSSIGQLDEDAVFYLRSRGIAERAARDLLTRAFAQEVVATLDVAPIRERLSALVDARFNTQESVR